jgi:hypothetical protein
MSHKRPSNSSDEERFEIPHSPYVENWAELMEELDRDNQPQDTTAPPTAPQVRAPGRPDLVVLISPQSQERLDGALDAGALRCRPCRRIFSCLRKLRVHCAGHYTALFCSCGFATHQKMTLVKHRRENGCQGGAQVCPDRLAEFVERFCPRTVPTEVPLRPVTTPQLKSVVVTVTRVDSRPPTLLLRNPETHPRSRSPLLDLHLLSCLERSGPRGQSVRSPHRVGRGLVKDETRIHTAKTAGLPMICVGIEYPAWPSV